MIAEGLRQRLSHLCALLCLLAYWGYMPRLAAGEIIVAAYNLENYLRMERVSGGRLIPDAPKPAQEVDAVVDVLTQIRPDILGVEEIGDEDMLADLRLRLKSAGLDLPHSEWVRGSDPARHIALLSRFPIVRRDSRDDIPFELNGTIQRVSRGILDVTIEPSPGFQLRILGVHLKSRRPVPSFDEAAMRAREALIVRAHLDEILTAKPDSKVLLFGDLNDTKNSYAVKELIGAAGSPRRMEDLAPSDGTGARWTHYWEAADVYSRIDYLLVSRALRRAVVKSRTGISGARNWFLASDHRAVYTTLRLPAP